MKKTILLFAAVLAFAQTVSVIPPEAKAAYWQAFAVFSQTEAAFQSTLTDQQKKLMVEREQLYRAATDARDKVEKICATTGGTIDPEEAKKNNLVCKAAKPATK